MATLDAAQERRGVVTEFDGHRGLGTVRDSSGREHPFHCVSIADGTRTIEVGAPVTFDLRPKLGRLEAVALRPIHSGPEAT